MSRLTQSIQLCFCLPRFLLPGGTISTVFLLTYSWSRLLTCPNHLNLAFRPSLSCIFSRLNGPSTGRQRTLFQHGWQHVCLPMSLVLRFDSFPLSEKCTLSVRVNVKTQVPLLQYFLHALLVICYYVRQALPVGPFRFQVHHHHYDNTLDRSLFTICVNLRLWIDVYVEQN